MPGTPWPGLTHTINHHYSQASLRISVFPSFIYRRRIKYELNDGFCGDCPGGSKTKQKRSEVPLSEHWERDVDSHQPNAEQRRRKLENECYGECHRVHGDSNEKMKMDASWSSANGFALVPSSAFNDSGSPMEIIGFQQGPVKRQRTELAVSS